MEERVIPLRQRTVMVRGAGDPDGAAVIYFHGSPGSRLDVQLAEQHAEADGVRLISFDRPGYGGSEPGSFGLHQMALLPRVSPTS